MSEYDRPKQLEPLDPQRQLARIGILPGQTQLAETSGIIKDEWKVTIAASCRWLDIPVVGLVNTISALQHEHGITPDGIYKYTQTELPTTLNPLFDAILHSMKNIDPFDAVKYYDKAIASHLGSDSELTEKEVDEVRELALEANLYLGVKAFIEHCRLAGIPLQGVFEHMSEIDQQLKIYNLDGIRGQLEQLNIVAEGIYARLGRNPETPQS